MPNRFPFNTPEHPDDNYSINKAFDRNYGNRLKSGDTTTLKYTIKDGDGEPLDKERLPNMQTSLILKYEGVTAYKTEFEATLEEVTENYVGDLVARFRIDEALPPSDTPYVVEFHFEDDEDLFIFPSVNTLELYITPSALNSDEEAIDKAADERLNEIVERKLEENPVLLEVEANELARQENYQELLDTGVMQTKINERLEDLEEEYAPKLTEVTAQLAQTESDIARRGINILELGFDIKTDGSDTGHELNEALEWCVDNGYSAFIPKGIYTVGRKDYSDTAESTGAFYIPDNLTLYVETGVVIKLKANEPGWTRVVYPGNNVKIYGHLEIDGSAETIEDGNEHMAGLFLYNVKNLYIESLYSYNCYGDNVQISGDSDGGGSEFIIIDRLRCRKAGRKNLVIEHSNFVSLGKVFLDNKEGTSGLWTGGGCLDVEPFLTAGRDTVNKIDHLETTGGNDFAGNENQWMVIGTLLQHDGEFTIYGLSVKVNEMYMHGHSHIRLQYTAKLHIDTLYSKSLINQETGLIIANMYPLPPSTEKRDQLYIGNLYHEGVENNQVPPLIKTQDIRMVINNLTVINHENSLLEHTNTYSSYGGAISIGYLSTFNVGKEGGNIFVLTTVGQEESPVNTHLSIGHYDLFDDRVTSPESIFLFRTKASNAYISVGGIANEKKIKLMSTQYGNFIPKIFVGGVLNCLGVPEGEVDAPFGTIAVDLNGTAGSTFFVKENGDGNTGWSLK